MAPPQRLVIIHFGWGRGGEKRRHLMQRQLVQNFAFILEWGQGTSLTKLTWRWTYSALLYFFPACCLFRIAAFFLKSDNKTNSVQLGWD